MLTVICPPDQENPFELVMREDGIRQIWHQACLLQDQQDLLAREWIPDGSIVWLHNEKYISLYTYKLLMTGIIGKTSSHDGMTNDEPRPFQQFLDENPKASRLPLLANQQQDVFGVIGSVTAINVARLGQPEHLKYFARNHQRTASGQAHTDIEQAEGDALAWQLGKPVTYQQHAVVPMAKIFPTGLPKPTTTWQPLKPLILLSALAILGLALGRRS